MTMLSDDAAIEAASLTSRPISRGELRLIEADHARARAARTHAAPRVAHAPIRALASRDGGHCARAGEGIADRAMEVDARTREDDLARDFGRWAELCYVREPSRAQTMERKRLHKSLTHAGCFRAPELMAARAHAQAYTR